VDDTDTRMDHADMMTHESELDTTNQLPRRRTPFMQMPLMQPLQATDEDEEMGLNVSAGRDFTAEHVGTSASAMHGPHGILKQTQLFTTADEAAAQPATDRDLGNPLPQVQPKRRRAPRKSGDRRRAEKHHGARPPAYKY